MSFNQWQSLKVGDVADVLNGYAFKSKDFTDEGIPVIKIKNIVPPSIELSDVQYVSEELFNEKERFALKYNDILISMTGSNVNQIASAVGKVGRVRLKNKKLLLNQRVGKLYVTDSDKCNEDFLYYYLIQDEVRYNLALSASGSANQANINPNQIKNISINLPPLDEQKAIAKVLSDLDEKIETNNKINKKLEEMAQAIFKQWFVDFEFTNEDGKPYKSSGGEMVESELGMIPKGWLVNNLGDLINIVDNRGKTPPQEKEKTEYPIIDVKALSGDSRVIDYNNCLKFVSKSTYENWFRSGHPADGDILMSTVGSLAELKIFYGNVGCIAQNVVALRSKGISNLYLYQYLKYIKNTLVSYNIGSVQPSIKITHVIKHKILIPNEEIINKYHNNLYSISQIIFNNSAENEKLISLRDTLLPKLMSGEIRVPID
ncbi:restriction endonuclease subunit S [Clostridium saudiense]|uniref:restriction endonuclease subunit S n=1 Tax=Clostridium saudiense TaxID=1414720 RepID=UPI00266FB4FE|nr:restriction endonuclease subunit S [Clostridium saudiense]